MAAEPEEEGGFEVPETAYLLRFEGDDMVGLEVYARAPSIGQLMQIATQAPAMIRKAEAAARRGKRKKTPTASDAEGELESFDTLFDLFVGVLDSWNLKRKGTPVPATKEGLLSLPPEFALRIVNGMQNTIIQAPPPLPSGSGTGPPGMEAQIPMTPRLPPPSPPS